ncbi:MAG: hypothetical protein OEL66_10230, partial [Desulfobulbaceae bacterium]|nr:hypothetical protein [Desulfobulbaceae bacterium]
LPLRKTCGARLPQASSGNKKTTISNRFIKPPIQVLCMLDSFSSKTRKSSASCSRAGVPPKPSRKLFTCSTLENDKIEGRQQTDTKLFNR